MPEGVEVSLKAEEFFRHVRKYGNTLINVEYKKGKKYNVQLDSPFIVNRIFSRGKLIIMEENNRNSYIVIHLGMTGNLLYKNPDKHSHVTFTFLNSYDEDNDEEQEYNVYFSDTRRFGSVNKYTTSELEDVLKNHGPCLLIAAKILYEDYNPKSVYECPASLDIFKEKLKQRYRRSRTVVTIAEYLMEQKHTSSIGLYLRTEILYVCKISPFTNIGHLSDEQINLLYKKTLETLYQSYICKGPSGGYITNGSFPLLVYQKEEDKFGNKVLRCSDKNKRTVHYVPNIQV